MSSPLLDRTESAPESVARVEIETKADLTALIGELRARPDVADRATAEFLDQITGQAIARGSGKTMSIMIRLPLLVHGAQAGDPGPARLAAILHLLWWTAARFLDDLADRAEAMTADPIAANRGILTALMAGNQLPTVLIGAADVDPVTMTRLHAEFARGWADAISGQLLDFEASPATATPESVLRSYRGKTGAPYAMACALAAVLAGADADRTDRWRELGGQFGVLRQLVNDQLDLASGRDEDLANGTATYLLAYARQSLPAPRDQEFLALHAAAATSPQGRRQLRERLLDPAVVRGYRESVGAMVGAARATLDELGGDPAYVAQFHALIDEAMSQSPPPFAR